ncbi:MAG TPA: M81 family metallopeptidase [Bryobacteraceae bacterium]|nr:M81 family metallopeptidase [Bryobacteraceae bacterium]
MTRFLPLVLCATAALAQTHHPLIAVGGIKHESDSFNPAKTGLHDFRIRPVSTPEATLAEWAKAKDEISGFVLGARQYGLDLYPTLVTYATPRGPVTDEAFNYLTGELIRRLKAAPHLDGLLLALHGAMVEETYPQGDPEIVRRLRAVLGPSFPIIVTHDFHANVSQQIVDETTALITYKQNPHLDTQERGIQAARIMSLVVSGRVKPVQALAKPPMLYNIVYQQTSRPPLKPITDESRRLERNPKILAVSVPGGYQYADVPAMGPSVIVVTDNDPELAKREAKRLSDMLWDTRDQLRLHLPEAAEAVRQAMASDRFPVTLMDMGDNVGGGSAGDSTFLLAELLRQKAQGWVMTIYDPQAVQAAVRAGIGGSFDMPVGGKTDKFHGDPVPVRGRVKSLHDGKYIETEVRHGGGRYFDQGLTAVIEVEGSTPDLLNLLVLNSHRVTPDSLQQIVSLGIYPERQHILIAKGTIAPRAAYEPIAAKIIPVDTPGLTAVNPARYTFKRVRRPLFGLDPEKP